MTPFFRVLPRAMLLFLTIWIVLSSIVFAQRGSDASDIRAQNAFWSAVAGEGPVRGIGAQAALSRALMRDLDQINEPRDFIAPPNTYRGISEDLGFNPFNEEGLNCNECGPLTEDMVIQVKTIREQGSGSLIVPVPEVVFGLFPAVPAALEVAYILLLSMFIAFATKVFREKKRDSLEKELNSRNLLHVYRRLGAELQRLEDMPAAKKHSKMVSNRISEIKSVLDEIVEGLSYEDDLHDRTQFDARLENTDNLLEETKQYLKDRREALKEL